MAADAWLFYDSFRERVADGGHDLDNDTFYMALFLSGGNADTDSLTQLSAVTSQHANANGYLTGGKTVGTPTWVEATGTVTFDHPDVVWTASGGSIICRFAVIYNFTHASDILVCRSLLDNTPGDVEATDTNTLTIAPNASGVFTLTGG